MSTRSTIGYMEKGSEEVHYIYCHYDGYPSHNGVMLNECYNTIDKVKELVDKGNMSSLSTHIKGVEYYENEPAEKCDAWDYNYKDCGYDAEYLYLFEEETNTWVVESEKGVENLDEVLHDYETFLKIEGGKYIDDKKQFNDIQENIEEVRNLYCCWHDNYQLSSVYEPDNNAVKLTYNNGITGNHDNLYIPCESREEAIAITDNIVGKSLVEITNEYNLETDYKEVSITSADAIFNALKNSLLESNPYSYGINDSLVFTCFVYKDQMEINYSTDKVRGYFDEYDKGMVLDYINGDYKEQNTPSFDDEER